MGAQHFVSISGGKDSQASALRMVERAERRGFGNKPPRFLFSDTGNENKVTLEHVAYLSDWLFQRIGVGVETVSAYDVPGLIDAAAFEHRRAVIREQWPHERRRKKHWAVCRARRDRIPPLAAGCRHSPERSAALREWAAMCDCPVIVSPPIPDDMIERALAALKPTGIAFVDMAMIHGRFPGARTRFCTDELKLAPMMAKKRPLLDEGVSIVEWIGERADESARRAAKPPIERIRHVNGAVQILYRPIFRWSAADAFAISARFGLRNNPLYTRGMSRVGCFPCVNCTKGELGIIATEYPAFIDQLREWEVIVGAVSRRSYVLGVSVATFFPAPMVPGPKDDETRAQIDRAVDWALGRIPGQIGLFADDDAVAASPPRCVSAYGLCE